MLVLSMALHYDKALAVIKAHPEYIQVSKDDIVLVVG